MATQTLNYGPFALSSGQQTNATAQVSVQPTQGDTVATRIRLDQIIVSSSGTVGGAARLTVSISIGGTRQTLGMQIPATAFGEPLSIPFPRGLLADPGTNVDVTLPALGTGIVGELVVIGSAAQS